MMQSFGLNTVLVVTAVLDIIQLATSFNTSTGTDKFCYGLEFPQKQLTVINYVSLPSCIQLVSNPEGESGYETSVQDDKTT